MELESVSTSKMTDIGANRGPCFGARHLQTLLLFLAMAISFCERLNVSVSLVAMTNAASTNPNFHEFDWDEKQRSYIISAFYWGYVITQFPAGYMASKIGVKLMLLLSIFCCTLCTIIIPLCVPWGGWQIYCVIRFVQGLCQGFLFPCIYDHLASWSPSEELTRLGGLSHTGLEFGSIFAMSLSGVVAGSDMGWPGVFYVFGAIGLVFCIIWMVFAENSPSRSQRITQEEKDYIMDSQEKAKDSQTSNIPIPWKAIFTSVPFLSLAFVGMCQLWGFVMMQSYIPPYLHGVLKMDIKSNALFSTLPFITMWIFSYIFAFSADLVLTKKWLTLDVVRKTVNSIGMWGPAVMLIAIGFLDESQKTLAITLMILIVGLNAGHTVGALLNIIDLSPNHAGILMGILNAVCNMVPIFSPLVIGRILSDETNRVQWQIVFIITAIVFFFGNLQYIFLGSTNTQIWNDEYYLLSRDREREKEKKNKTERETGIINNSHMEQRVY